MGSLMLVCYVIIMSNSLDIETVLERFRALPRERQESVAPYIAELTEELEQAGSIVRLSADERAVLDAELAGAKRGEYATDEEVADVLGRSWA